MSEAQGRLHGLETEWSIFVPNQEGTDGVQLSGTVLNALLKRYYADKRIIGTPNGCFVANGARKYVDCGEHYETTTPESLSTLETAACDIGDEREVREIMEGELMGNDSRLTRLDRFQIHKRSLSEGTPTAGSSNKSTGCHENYSVKREAVNESGGKDDGSLSEGKLALLGVHMAARGVFFGVGALLPSGDFVIAQKASEADCDYMDNTTNHKPVINTRNQPEATASEWARIHHILGDPNMSPWNTRMKLGTSSLVLTLMEHGVDLPELRFADSLTHISRRVAKDVNLSQPLRLAKPWKDGTEAITALEAEMYIAGKVAKLSGQAGFSISTEDSWTIEQWLKVGRDTAQDPKLVRDRNEWIVKLEILELLAEKEGLSWQDVRLRQKERQWDLIDPSGIGMRLREGRWSKWMPPEDMIVRARHEPPINTRANIRGRFVQTFAGTGASISTWSILNRANIAENSVTLGNPYQSVHPVVEQWIQEHEAAEALQKAS